MSALDMLDVAIGIIFIYMLLSLLCSAINELFEAWLKMRAVDLEQGIRELLQSSPASQPSLPASPSLPPKSLTNMLYEHPLIFSLFRGNYDPSKITDGRYKSRSDLPSYIPARNFALALMDVILPSIPSTPGGAKGNGGTTGATAPPVNAALIGAGIPLPPADPLKPLRDAINTSPALTGNNQVQQALLSLIDAAGNDVNQARKNIENWYNSSMDRVAGWYKRRVQVSMWILGFVLAAAVNADSFAIFSSLVNDKPMRDAVVTMAASTPNSLEAQMSAKDRLATTETALLKLKLPIGWYLKAPTEAANDSAKIENRNLAIPTNIWDWIVKVIGWLVTGIAISLGAPFWFDLLNKVMVIRSTVKPTEKSPNEASEDRQR